MTKFKEWPDYANVDILVGGTPCQSFSIAGLRKGLDDPRGNLMLTYLAIAARYKPRWLVWENVPGVLSSNSGKDFGALLGGLAEIGYGFAYRVLDAQYFGVAQRRRRVFVVGCFGDWRSAASVLFEQYSMSGNIEPSREKRQKTSADVAKCLTKRGAGGGNLDTETANFVPVEIPEINPCLETTSNDYSRADGFTAIALAGNTIGRKPENGGNSDGFNTENLSYTLTKTDVHAIAYQDVAGCLCKNTFTGGGMSGRPDTAAANHLVPTLTKNGDAHSGFRDEKGLVFSNMQVRRLTEKECERLQGFPDNYTNIQDAKGTPRYAALGNSMAVPVMKWIGKRIQMHKDLNL